MNSTQSLENFVTNTDLIIYLFKLLNLEDQLRLAQVNSEFGNIFETYICRKTYRTLNINPNKDDFVVTNESNCDRVALKPGEFQTFLQFNAMKVKVLTERRGPRIDLRPFRNLTSLSYRNMQIPRQHLQSIAENCPQLESISLYYCTDDDSQFIVIGENWSVETLLKMKNLKSLSLENAIQVSIDYGSFRQLLKNLQLEYLHINCGLYPEEDVVETEFDPVPLKELNIWTTFHPEAYPNDFSAYLINYQNLRKLTLKSLDNINDEIMNNMSKACSNLETLSIQFSIFENLQTFSIPSQVLELSLYSCQGLTQNNLRQILTQLKIIKFSSVSVDYEGTFADFHISPNIQSLDFNAVHTHKFKSAYEGNVNIKELTWYDDYYFTDDSHYQVNLNGCINLEMLHMLAGFVPLETIMQLPNLRKLNIPQSMSRLNWTYIEGILKHPKLEEIVMNNHCSPRSLAKASNVPVLGFSSNVKTVKITEDVFVMALDFWLDLFNQSEALELVVYNFRRDKEFIKTLINHNKFPRKLKALDICCFTINCSDLRKHLDATMEKLCNDTVDLSKEYDESLYRIIFCWK